MIFACCYWFNNFWFDHQCTFYLWHFLGTHCSCTCQEWCFASSASRKNFKLGFSECFFFFKTLVKCEKIVSCLMQYSKKIWEMIRNLGAHPAQLLNPIISKFCYSFYMVITLHSLKKLLSLLLLSHFKIYIFYQSANWNFLGLVIPCNCFWRWVETIVSIIVFIISNTTVLMSRHVICFGYLCQ